MKIQKENDEPLELTEEEQEEPDTEQEDKQINEEDPPKVLIF